MFEDPASIDFSPNAERAPLRSSMASRRWVVRRRSRLARAERLQVAEGCWAAGQTQRQVAADVGVARSTLQDWHRADRGGAAPAALAAFVATPEGVQWLHQLVLAAHWVITLQGGAGVRVVCQLLELTGLSAFVGASYGTQQALNAALEEAIVTVAQEQRAALATGMPHRQVTVVEDETLHPHICLVGLEPVSNFNSPGAVCSRSHRRHVDRGTPGRADGVSR